MNVRFRFKSFAKAEKVRSLLPVSCESRIIGDGTTDAYLEVPEEYEVYIESYLYTNYRDQ